MKQINDAMKNARRSLGAGVAFIILLSVMVYLPAMHGGFVFDDFQLITGNKIVKASNGLHRFWFTTEAADFYPLTSSLWWLEWRLWGNNPLGYHVVNVLLHAVNAVLVWLILRGLKIPGAWLAAMVFAVHPVNVATVAWISEQKNTLSMLFYLIAILLYLRFDEEGQWRWYGFSLAAFLLALFSKTAVVMLPVVLLGCVWWLRGRVRWKDLRCSVPYFVLSLVLGLVTVWFQHNRALEGHVIRTEGFLSQLAVAGCVPWFYLYKTFLPFELSMIYPRWNINASLWISYLPGLALAGCFTLFWWRRRTWGRPLVFGLGYFVVTLFPVLGFFDQGFYRYSLVADHWQYPAIIAPIALAVATGENIWQRSGGLSRYVGALACGVVLMSLGVATWTRSCVYETDKTLWRDTLAKNPNAAVAHTNLGLTLWREGRYEEAVGHFEQSLRIDPDNADAHNNLGGALLRLGKLQAAIAHFEQALRLEPDDADMQNNLGAALRQAGRTQEAIGHLEQALRLKPDSTEAHNNLGLALQQTGKTQEAIKQFEQALRLKPDSAEAHNNLGLALQQTGKTQEAIEQFEQALRLRPDYAKAHYNMGIALEQMGNPEDAIGHYEQALRLRPDYPEARASLQLAQQALAKPQERGTPGQR